MAVALGQLVNTTGSIDDIRLIASADQQAPRQANVRLLSAIDELLKSSGVAKQQLSCVVCGLGPGSFTGVRIALATAKGIARGLHLSLYGVSTIDAIAWQAWQSGLRGELAVVADAMRQEIYPARFTSTAEGVTRNDTLTVSKVAETIERWREQQHHLTVLGDGLQKYATNFDTTDKLFELADQSLWACTGLGLLLAFADNRARQQSTDAGAVLPIYTRLSDAEENERRRLLDGGQIAQGAEVAIPPSGVRQLDASPSVHYRPLAKQDIAAVSALEAQCFTASPASGERWSEASFQLELTAPDRIWWTAWQHHQLLGFAGGWLIDGDLEILDIAVATHARRQGIGRNLLSRLLEDARALGAHTASLEVRASNSAAQALYHSAGFELAGRRPGYYAAETATTSIPSQREDALILTCRIDNLNQGIHKDIVDSPVWGATRTSATQWSVAPHTGLSSDNEQPSSEQPSELSTKYNQDIDERGMTRTSAKQWSVMPNTSISSGDETQASTAHDSKPVTQSNQDIDERGMTRTSAKQWSVMPCSSVSSGGKTLSNPYISPLILGIETSCDETAAAIIDGAGWLRANVVASQVDYHARFGGVVPEIASRKHTEAIVGVVDAAMEQAGLNDWKQLSALAVTYAPGLIGALVVGVAFAKGLAWATDLPLIRVNHLEGHIYANRLRPRTDASNAAVSTADSSAASPSTTNPTSEPYDTGFSTSSKLAKPVETLVLGDTPAPPFVIALLSGGHTMLVEVLEWAHYRVLGQTLDDAVGEAFDKVAKALGLGYPGGPVISRLAAEGDPQAIDFPRALLHSHDFNFSLSGLKTAVITWIRQQQQSGAELNLANVAAAFQQAVIDVQVAKALAACRQSAVSTFCLGGGVAANQALRDAYVDKLSQAGIEVFFPPLAVCSDNAAMIVAVATDRYARGQFMSLSDDAAAQSDLSQDY
jgi:N6-L-threonylcarbamoyladenine synthase